VLTSTLGGLSADSRREMFEHDGRFGFIAMLAAWSASPLVSNFAVSQQEFSGGLHGMEINSRHRGSGDSAGPTFRHQFVTTPFANYLTLAENPQSFRTIRESSKEIA
jgi:hypothetical protein